MYHCGTPRNLKEPPEHQQEELYPQIRLFVAAFCNFPPIVFPFHPPSPIPNVSAVSKRLVMVGAAEYMSDEQGKWAQRTTTEPGGTSTDHQQDGTTPSSPPFSWFSRFGSSPFLLASPFAQYPTFRRLRKSSHWFVLECRRDGGGIWWKIRIAPHRRTTC